MTSDDEDVDDDGNDDADDSDNMVDADDDDSEGKSLTCKARVSLGLPVNTVFCCIVKGEVQQEPVKDESCLLSSYHHDTHYHRHYHHIIMILNIIIITKFAISIMDECIYILK